MMGDPLHRLTYLVSRIKCNGTRDAMALKEMRDLLLEARREQIIYESALQEIMLHGTIDIASTALGAVRKMRERRALMKRLGAFKGFDE